MHEFYKCLCTFFGLITDAGSLAWEHLVDYRDFLWRLAKRFAFYAAIPIPALLICLIFGWPVNWFYSAYFIFVGAEAVILMVLAFPIIAAAQFIFDKFPQFAGSIQKSVRTIAAVAFWALMLAVYFYVFPFAENPKMVPLVLMASAALAFGVYAGWVYLPRALLKTVATVFLVGIFVIATFAFCFPYRTQQLVGLTHIVDMAVAQPKRLTISYEDLEKERITFFGPHAKPLVWYFKTDDGRFELFDKQGSHPIYKEELKPLTAVIVSQVKKQLKEKDTESKEKKKAKEQQEAKLRQERDQEAAPQPKRLNISHEDIDQERISFFRQDGKPLVWYCETGDGRFELFDKGGCHPIYKMEFKPITPDIVAKIKKQLKQEETESKEKEQKTAEVKRKAKKKAEAERQAKATRETLARYFSSLWLGDQTVRTDYGIIIARNAGAVDSAAETLTRAIVAACPPKATTAKILPAFAGDGKIAAILAGDNSGLATLHLKDFFKNVIAGEFSVASARNASATETFSASLRLIVKSFDPATGGEKAAVVIEAKGIGLSEAGAEKMALERAVEQMKKEKLEAVLAL